MTEIALTILNTYQLTAPAERFVEAIDRLAARVQAEGHPGVRSYRFFVNADAGVARAIVDYTDAAAWIGHHDIAMAWPEMRALHAVANLDHVVFLGDMTPEIARWIENSTLKARIETGFRFAAGFRRPPA